ncbi:ADAMTS-like protein 4 isoform X2 [Bacillus rossius redtenbacheri]|uniref:ADAMTS-like protein 4 isoform X2 n=1 Tax=Bacillus rossius redtenbacheri TaxID=93214 RepID=UPI002FDE99DB
MARWCGLVAGLLCLLHVGCDGVVGSARRADACGVCGGANSTCRLVSGLFTMARLPEGYSLVAQLPRGACNLTVQEMQPSANYLALRRLDGQYIVNGNWAINWSGVYEGAGTHFTFRRQDAARGDVITAPGPLLEPVDIMLLYQQPNPGIKYEYMLPMRADGTTPPVPRPAPGVAGNSVIAPPFVRPGAKQVPGEQTVKDVPVQDWPHNRSPVFPYGSGVLGTDSQQGEAPHKPPPKSRGRKRKFAWKLAGFSECSKTCAGGMSASMTVCVRESTQVAVPDKRCSHSEKPRPQLMRCNTKPCPAEWVAADWGECSATCGDGVQSRELACKQEITASLTMKVADGACLRPPQHARTQPCHRPACPGSPQQPLGGGGGGGWRVGDWGQCSATCGKGVRTRAVQCADADGAPRDDCAQTDRPAAEEACNQGGCGEASKHSPWLFTEWSQQCSEECGTGVQTRRVHCSGETCDVAATPDDSRACSSDKQCSGKWFVGPWGTCSPGCGPGQQSRDVLCVAFIRGQHRVALEMNCPVALRPAGQQACQSAACEPDWFFSDWTPCSRDCGAGVQRRDVRCLDDKRQPTSGCPEDTRPPGRRVCNAHDCPGGDRSPGGLLTRADDDPTVTNGAGDQALPDETADKDCVDAYPNCHLVVQARLCKYKYYRTYCCHSCRKKS